MPDQQILVKSHDKYYSNLNWDIPSCYLL